jgi:transcriptional regulator with XRE-family HTH domain
MRLDADHLRAVAAKHEDKTDEQIAKQLNVSKSTMSRLFNGRNLPAARTFAKIETAYGLTSSDLLVADDLPAAA